MYMKYVKKKSKNISTRCNQHMEMMLNLFKRRLRMRHSEVKEIYSPKRSVGILAMSPLHCFIKVF